jgi:succinate dehydrogenase/fumarate reductase flavoprotein subunit
VSVKVKTMSESRKIVVLGTGGAGLTAAIAAHDFGAQVHVLEKADKVGGTTAWSGGMVWIPNNHLERQAGVADSREEALTYLMSMSHGLIERHLAEAFVDAGPQMVRHLCERTPVQFRTIQHFPDYHAEFPGGKTGGGRSLDTPPYSFLELGEWEHRVTPSPYYPDPRLSIYDTPLGQAVPEPVPEDELARRSSRHERASGQALIGRLLRGCLDRGIAPRTSTRALELVVRDGVVRGLIVEGGAGREEIACDAVILATGGFEWSEELKRSFLRGPMTHPVSIDTNTGDGLRMAMRVGAMLGNMREAWWMPVAEVPREEVSTGVTLVAGIRSLPRSIMVNRKARRFTNESANYNAIGAAFHDQDVSAFDYANLPCWMVFDHGFIERYGFPITGGKPGVAPPQWVPSAPTLAGLAARLAIPADALEATVKRWNAQVAGGRDDDFRRGEAAHDQWWGDATKRGGVQASLGPVDRGPFYAVEIKSGALGTKGGPKTNVNANVLNVDGQPIVGLYAAGNVMSSPMGMTYGGAGGTIAPGMVFGFLAGRHAAGSPVFADETAQ